MTREKGETLRKVKRYFISGLVIFLPVMLTLYLFLWTLAIADGLLGRFIEPYFEYKFGFYFRGLSLLITISLIFLIGFLAANFLGRKIQSYGEALLLRLPFFRQVYPAFKEIAMFLFSREKMAFTQVVFIQYPRQGIYSMGFLTNQASAKVCDFLGPDMCNVFVPTVPSPLTGFVVIVPKKEVVETNIPVEAAVKFLVSGGVVNP
jgi:uncharacterized membrane protein